MNTMLNSLLKDKKVMTGVVVAMLLFGIGLISYFMTSGGPGGLRTHANEPDENSFYLAVQDDKPVLFYRYEGLMIDSQHAEHAIGFVIPYEEPFDLGHDHKNYGDFKQLKDPKKIFSFEGLARIDNIKLSEDKEFLAMSVLGGPVDSTNYLYEVNLKTLAHRTLLERELRGGQSQLQGSTAYIFEYIPDQYIVYALIKGSPPPAKPPLTVVVKNIKTGDEKVLGSVGDTKIDVEASTISFKPYGEVQEPCGKPKDPDCFPTDTFKMVSKPTGPTQTQPLP